MRFPRARGSVGGVKPLVAACLLFVCGGTALADGPQPLPLGTDVPLSLTAGGGAAYDVGSTGMLSVQLQAGDIGVSVRSDDGSSSTQSSMNGSGSATLAVSNSAVQTYHLVLTSEGGAQLKVRFDPGALGSGNVVSSLTSVSSSSVSSSSVNSVSSVSVFTGQ